MKPLTAPDPKRPPTSERAEPVPFTFWDRDRAHQDRLAKRMGLLRRSAHASNRRAAPRAARAG